MSMAAARPSSDRHPAARRPSSLSRGGAGSHFRIRLKPLPHSPFSRRVPVTELWEARRGGRLMRTLLFALLGALIGGAYETSQTFTLVRMGAYSLAQGIGFVLAGAVVGATAFAAAAVI